MKTRGDYEAREILLSETTPSRNSADLVLTLSRRLVKTVKVKNILQIEATLEMMALAIAISSEVCDVIEEVALF